MSFLFFSFLSLFFSFSNAKRRDGGDGVHGDVSMIMENGGEI